MLDICVNTSQKDLRLVSMWCFVSDASSYFSPQLLAQVKWRIMVILVDYGPCNNSMPSIVTQIADVFT